MVARLARFLTESMRRNMYSVVFKSLKTNGWYSLCLDAGTDRIALNRRHSLVKKSWEVIVGRCLGSMNSPGMRRYVPKVISASEACKSSLKVMRKPRSTAGSTLCYGTSGTLLKAVERVHLIETFKVWCMHSTMPLDFGWYDLVWTWWAPRRRESKLGDKIQMSWLSWWVLLRSLCQCKWEELVHWLSSNRGAFQDLLKMLNGLADSRKFSVVNWILFLCVQKLFATCFPMIPTEHSCRGVALGVAKWSRFCWLWSRDLERLQLALGADCIMPSVTVMSCAMAKRSAAIPVRLGQKAVSVVVVGKMLQFSLTEGVKL